MPRLCKCRSQALLFMGCFFLFLWYFVAKNYLLIDIEQRAFENYIKIRTPNPSCPWLNQSEWKIYKNLTTPSIFVLPEERSTLSLKDLGLVSFVSRNHMKEALASCASILAHPQLRHLSFTMFFSSDINESLADEYQKACPLAKTQMFPFEKFPNDVQILEHYRFKPLYTVMAFKNHKMLLSFDTSILFRKNANFTGFIEKNIKENPLDVTLFLPANHNIFSTAHPKMHSCFPEISPESMIDEMQFQAGNILWIGTKNGWNTMKRLVECSLQPSCLAPPGATNKCNMGNIYKFPKNFSGCHRFDQTAINLILYENSGHKPQLYQRKSDFFRISRIKQL